MTALWVSVELESVGRELHFQILKISLVIQAVCPSYHANFEDGAHALVYDEEESGPT